ncbi:uncharacterized protein MYCFIDRAFT_174964 [Pseudocercospora fijiensis CIRAD86]|uniref:Uncharacterized protein n=1 Tax=Pseudocercospora fijiensis (strain CIRAD86) TaxID=383855 RepID=M2Z115_PSEFD|nr:uncharacterized protein MYCFIDRAFT_174964 [Pseudocercospora fijiensis CIRAD86]EME83535.1 hypothetical protein MYCFIDRAFT_174964 [Pseudocercospora fijiensis CIRAD86]
MSLIVVPPYISSNAEPRIPHMPLTARAERQSRLSLCSIFAWLQYDCQMAVTCPLCMTNAVGLETKSDGFGYYRLITLAGQDRALERSDSAATKLPTMNISQTSLLLCSPKAELASEQEGKDCDTSSEQLLIPTGSLRVLYQAIWHHAALLIQHSTSAIHITRPLRKGLLWKSTAIPAPLKSFRYYQPKAISVSPSNSSTMQFITTTILLSLSAAVMSAPAAAPDAAPNAAAEAVPVAFAAPAAAPEPVLTGLFERRANARHVLVRQPLEYLMPRNLANLSSICTMPSRQARQVQLLHQDRTGRLGQRKFFIIASIILLLCNVLNGNTISVPVTLSVLSSLEPGSHETTRDGHDVDDDMYDLDTPWLASLFSREKHVRSALRARIVNSVEVLLPCASQYREVVFGRFVAVSAAMHQATCVPDHAMTRIHLGRATARGLAPSLGVEKTAESQSLNATAGISHFQCLSPPSEFVPLHQPPPSSNYYCGIQLPRPGTPSQLTNRHHHLAHHTPPPSASIDPSNPWTDTTPTYFVYRDIPAGEPFDPTSPLLFFPPKGSDELFDALRLAFPHLKTHSERLRDAIIKYLLEERHDEQTQVSPAPAPAMDMSVAWPSVSSSGSASMLSSPEMLDMSTPAYSPQPTAPQLTRQASVATSSQQSPPSLDQMTNVFSLSTSTLPKQRVRRKMTEAEKVEYRKRRCEGINNLAGPSSSEMFMLRRRIPRQDVKVKSEGHDVPASNPMFRRTWCIGHNDSLGSLSPGANGGAYPRLETNNPSSAFGKKGSEIERAQGPASYPANRNQHPDRHRLAEAAQSAITKSSRGTIIQSDSKTIDRNLSATANVTYPVTVDKKRDTKREKDHFGRSDANTNLMLDQFQVKERTKDYFGRLAIQAGLEFALLAILANYVNASILLLAFLVPVIPTSMGYGIVQCSEINSAWLPNWHALAGDGKGKWMKGLMYPFTSSLASRSIPGHSVCFELMRYCFLFISCTKNELTITPQPSRIYPTPPVSFQTLLQDSNPALVPSARALSEDHLNPS